MHVALFGGSFNPPHIGHQLAALYVLETAPVDELWFVPCFLHAFDKQLAAFAQRVALCEALALPLGPRVRVDIIEGQLGGTSRTLSTVKALQAAHPSAKFSLIIGSDLRAERANWFGAEELATLVDFLIVGRAEADPQAPVAMPAISSTDVRDRLAAGLSVDAQVPRRVLALIRDFGLYGVGETT